MRWLFWIGIALGADSLIVLLGLSHWQKIAPRFPVYPVALVEGLIALILLGLYHWLTRG